MPWKTYAAFSGAGLLAVYLFSSPTPIGSGGTSRPRPEATRGTAPADIEQQAERLQSRVTPDAEFHEPSRNPFRFGGGPVAARQPTRVEPEVVPDTPDLTPVDPLPAPPPIRLSGIATEMVDGVRQRSAILVTPAGMITVREGDAVGAEYRVTRIEEDAVQLVASDGTPRRITVR